MIHYSKGNLLQADVEAIINTVNCVGVMGKGIALQFKQAFPENFTTYAKACKARQVQPGHMFLFEREDLVNPRFIINFPTKTHWKAKSLLEHIEQGLVGLVQVIRDKQIKSIAIPPLGCGNGGLEWAAVRPLIEQALSQVPEVETYIYGPQSAPAVDAMPVATKTPNMTRARALFIKLIEQYSLPGYRLSLLEVQKLGYFLQEAGEALRLNYVKHHFGPYAENLNYVLQRIEGHFIRGYGDRSKNAQIHLMPDAVAQADVFLANDMDASQRLAQVEALIEGFETPYSMELLASVHWVSTREGVESGQEAVAKVQGWNSRKAKLMQTKHIQKAFEHLKDQQWVINNAKSTTL